MKITQRQGILRVAYRALIFKACSTCKNKEEAAEMLGLSPRTLRVFLKEEGYERLDKPDGTYDKDINEILNFLEIDK